MLEKEIKSSEKKLDNDKFKLLKKNKMNLKKLEIKNLEAAI